MEGSLHVVGQRTLTRSHVLWQRVTCHRGLLAGPSNKRSLQKGGSNQNASVLAAMLTQRCANLTLCLQIQVSCHGDQGPPTFMKCVRLTLTSNSVTYTKSKTEVAEDYP